MEKDWAAENLQTIRTLMERSALYRRALAPVMFLVGTIGLISGIAAILFNLKTTTAFVVWWFCAGAVAIAGTLLIARKQALKDAEPFWSAPTKRVVYSLCPSLFAGVLCGISAILSEGDHAFNIRILPAFWIVFYGIALNSAGFFMQRGMKFFGLLLVIAGSLLIVALPLFNTDNTFKIPNILMLIFFGAVHLAYGVYLHFTEKHTLSQ
jgi:hypothetical protein